MNTGGGDGAGPAGDRPAGPYVLREYALLADGYRGALVDPAGNVDWLCAPTWDSDAVFGALLGAGGRYGVTPTDPRTVWGGYYEPGTLIWTSRWVTTDGIVESREALALPGQERRLVLLRQVHAVDHDAELAVRLEPAAGFGQARLHELRRDGESWLARSGGLYLRCTGGQLLGPDDSTALTGRLVVPAGRRHDLVLEVSVDPIPEPPPDPETTWRSTERTWRSGVLPLPDCVARRDARFAHAVLRGLTRPGGGTVAAVTTSLPERARSGRNYDYRYAWIRDQCYTGLAAAAAGADDLLDSAVEFVRARLVTDGPALTPAYTAAGHPVPDERALPHLPGYPGGAVRVGNRVRGQFQLDTLGECLLLLAAAARRDRLDASAWHAVEIAAGAIERRWREPDSGIWELSPRQWTHSKLACVAGLRAAAVVAPAAQAARWASLADTVLADAGRHGVHRSGRWRRAYDDERVDAALLLPVIRGAIPADDPRSTATHRAVLDELAEDGYLYRYRPDERPLGEAEGAFLLCGFIAALATHQAGDPVGAHRWFERNRAGCGPPGLYTEEFDVQQRQLRGNLPQAFVHAMLLETAVTLAAPVRGDGGYAPVRR
ncbi:glycoside hydrolase family 15 protein [Micromonospora sp. HM5-17]|uniref:glycoside hydrolase family 15 protein n=1 Tax=Micromonospora sp. HM5-17 TaxID=2487710 RepID=UPI0026825D12|nr:glycoside hydrolase family 15 protein [Micromonospora sp. HM5-17]